VATRGVKEFIDSYIAGLTQPAQPFSGGGQMARRQQPGIVQSPFDRQVTGAMEAAGALGTGLAGAVPAGLEGLFTLARTGSPLEAGQRVEQIQEALTYRPRTQEGQQALSAVGEVLSPLAAPSEFVGQTTMEATGSPGLATFAEIFGDPLNFIPGLKGTMAAMAAIPPVIAKNVRPPQSVRAPVNQIGLYSKAEDVAMNMPQAKGRGDDTRRYFKKQGVKDEEIAALGLNKLFSQDRVTQQEILDHIDRNRLQMEEKISSGPSEGEFRFDYGEEDLSVDQAYGAEYIDEEAKYFAIDEPERFVMDDDDVDRLVRYAARNDDVDSVANLRELVKGYSEGVRDFDELPYSIQQEIYNQARGMVEENYNSDPIRRISLTVTDQNGQQQNAGDVPGASFSYTLVGNDDLGYAIDGLERDSVPSGIREWIENANITSADEAQVQLQAIANEYDEIGSMMEGDTKWGEHTLEGGDNYQEIRLSMPSDGETRFTENVHFPDDTNNIFHVRTKDRELPTGEKILYVEELQSDWAQRGRQVGFKSEEKMRAAEAASDELFEEVAPLLEPIDRTALYVSDSGIDDAFVSNVRRLSIALENYRRGGRRGLDAAGDILNTMKNANLEAERNAITNLREDFLDQLTDEQKVDLYVRETMGEFGGSERTRERVLRNWDNDPELARQAVEMEARRRLRDGSTYLDAQVIRAAEKMGDLPARNADGGAAIKSKPEWNEYLERIYDQRSRFLESKGIDPELVSKIQAALDKTDPGGDIRREGIEQRNKPTEGPFVGDTESWNKLAIKYIFKKAAEEGYDGVSFAPGQAQVDRWGDEGLKVQYDQNIPSAINKSIGPAPASPLTNLPETMTVDGYESKVYRLDDPTKEGESIREKMLSPTTMFGLGALPFVLPEGIEALQGLTPAQEEESASPLGNGRL
jgi:hypothetical protein